MEKLFWFEGEEDKLLLKVRKIGEIVVNELLILGQGLNRLKSNFKRGFFWFDDIGWLLDFFFLAFPQEDPSSFAVCSHNNFGSWEFDFHFFSGFRNSNFGILNKLNELDSFLNKGKWYLEWDFWVFLFSLVELHRLTFVNIMNSNSKS